MILSSLGISTKVEMIVVKCLDLAYFILVATDVLFM